MSKHDKIEHLKSLLNEEVNKETPNGKIINKLKKQIILLGLGLNGNKNRF